MKLKTRSQEVLLDHAFVPYTKSMKSFERVIHSSNYFVYFLVSSFPYAPSLRFLVPSEYTVDVWLEIGRDWVSFYGKVVKRREDVVVKKVYNLLRLVVFCIYTFINRDEGYFCFVFFWGGK